jgi:hypothetical protein
MKSKVRIRTAQYYPVVADDPNLLAIIPSGTNYKKRFTF